MSATRTSTPTAADAGGPLARSGFRHAKPDEHVVEASPGQHVGHEVGDDTPDEIGDREQHNNAQQCRNDRQDGVEHCADGRRHGIEGQGGERRSEHRQQNQHVDDQSEESRQPFGAQRLTQTHPLGQGVGTD